MDDDAGFKDESPMYLLSHLHNPVVVCSAIRRSPKYNVVYSVPHNHHQACQQPISRDRLSYWVVAFMGRSTGCLIGTIGGFLR